MGNINCCKEKVNVITAQNEPEVQPVHTTKTGKGNSVGGFFGGIFDKIKHLDGGNDNVEYDT